MTHNKHDLVAENALLRQQDTLVPYERNRVVLMHLTRINHQPFLQNKLITMYLSRMRIY